MPRVAIFGDTHVPSREPSIPDWVRDRVAAADHAVHVGDYDSPEALGAVREMAGDLTAVHGNMDPGTLDLPSVATLDVGSVRFVVTHGTGDPAGWEERVADVAQAHAGEGTTVGVAGHTHEVVDSERAGVRLLNPGSATGAAPATAATMLTVDVAGDEFAVEVHRE